MGRGSRVAWTLFFTTTLWMLVLPAANAYIDAGTGSYILQVVIGALAGVAIAVGAFWRRIWAFLTGRSRKREQPVDASKSVDG